VRYRNKYFEEIQKIDAKIIYRKIIKKSIEELEKVKNNRIKNWRFWIKGRRKRDYSKSSRFHKK